jgi:heme exporter protein A
MLTINNITCIKNQQVIFKNLGFSAGEGSCIILKGGNGSGKTTLLRTIAGLCQPESGNILWDEENIQDFYPDFSSNINYIGHKNFLKPQLDILQNIEFFASLAQSELLIPSAVKYFDLAEKLSTPIKNLSAGWQKKVLLSKLIYFPADIWLLDEPSVNLDQKNKEKLFNLIATKVKEGGLAIIASHDDIFDNLGAKFYLQDFKK